MRHMRARYHPRAMPSRKGLLVAACMLVIPASARAQRAAAVAFQARNEAGVVQVASDTAHDDSHAVALGAAARPDSASTPGAR